MLKKFKKGQILSIKDVNFQFPSLKNQILSNDFSKFNQFILKRDINQNEPILKKFTKTLNKKNTLRIIRDKVRNLSNNAKITIPQGARIEISHHYGIENFNRFGLSMITVYNSKYCKKLLFQFPNQVHPDQFHKVKDETFFILYGKVKLNVRKGKKSKKITRILNQGEIYTIKPMEIHSFSPIGNKGAIIEELSTQSLRSDSFYLDKKIERNKSRKSFISYY